MCIFSGPVEKVAGTNIFAALVGPKTQLTVYSNKVSLEKMAPNIPQSLQDPYAAFQYTPPYASTSSISAASAPLWWNDPVEVSHEKKDPIAMLLPVPLLNAPVENIKMVDMSGEREFFDKLKSAITPATYGGGDMSFGFSAQKRGGEPLQVRRCGPYRYSVVPNVESFSRLKPGVFQMDKSVIQFLQTRYAKGYAFLACLIDESAEFAPIAYVHPSDGRRLFLPTSHWHGHPGEEVATNDWDHNVYTIDKSNTTQLTDRRLLQAEISPATSKPILSGFPYRNHIDWSRLKQRKISGYNPNGDILVAA